MRLVIDCDFECSVPLVQFDVEFDSSVVKSSGEEYLLSFWNLLLINSESCVPRWFTGQLLDVVDELDLVSFIDCSECNFYRVKFSLENCHCGKRSPQCMLFNKAAQPNCLLEVCLVHMLVQHSWVGTDLQSSETAIKSSYSTKSSSKARHLSKLPDIKTLFNLL